MEIKKHISALGFKAKENTDDIFIKEYADNYTVEVDLKREIINYGTKIKAQNKSTQNFSQPENFVVLECVNRLLETGYQPQNVILEKTWAAGHGTSGRLDICVTRPDGSEYLLIECKTYGKEFDKAVARLKKDGGQLFTYFKFSNKADVILLYASKFNGEEISYKNEIIAIEDTHRKGDVKDFFNNWNNQTFDRGVWENKPYNIKNKKTFTKKNLEPLTEEVSQSIFHDFASILRKHSVSDKPNAFNKIFNLFLAKLYDEAKREEDELEFHWRENDHPVDFQIRLIDLHKKGLFDFLAKEIEGIDDSDFQAKTAEQILEKKKKYLKFNNVFAIKDVLNDADFDENQRVLKDVVQLLEKYQIRYPRKQQHLSDFFEQLLTTGLKQEVGQYFTPPPITKFIIRSLPLPKLIEQEVNSETPKLPAIIDYAAGSGHFITEALEEYQDIINNLSTKGFYPKAIKAVDGWVADPYEWASKFVYGIEKDYRLVKVAKVGCYFYGDGVAQIIHGDGLDSFATSKTYKGLLKDNINIEDSAKAKFSVVVSNPPYAVNDCKDDLEYIGAEKEYTLYDNLSDKSKDIECLFVERTKHLLKDGGVASIILPSSILNNTGIQTKTREIILKYFDIVAIAEFGSNTFMATGTNTVTLFLKRRSNKLCIEWAKSVAKIFETREDLTVNGIDKPVAKYVAHVWENATYEDYVTLLQQTPSKAIEQHELYKEYCKKLKFKNEREFWNLLLEREADKLLYFIITLKQQVVLVKSGEKEAEKRFLGYEFSSRRGSEGMHPMQRGKSVDDCTQLYNAKDLLDPTKASTYIYKAFANDFDFEIDADLQNNVSRHNLVDMLTFDRVEFEKTISLAVKKKLKIESKWELVKIGTIAQTQYGFTDKASSQGKVRYLRITDLNDDGTIKIHNQMVFISPTEEVEKQFSLKENDIVIARSGSVGKSAIYKPDEYGQMVFASYLIRLTAEIKKILPQYLFNFTKTKTYWNQVEANSIAVTQPNLNAEKIKEFQIPLPPIDIQQKIVSEIEVLEKREKKLKADVNLLKEAITDIIDSSKGDLVRLQEITRKIGSGATPIGGEGSYYKTGITLIRSQNVYDSEFYEKGLAFINDEQAQKLINVNVEENDILFNITGASVCRCCMINKKYLPARVNQHVAIIRTNEKALSKYIQRLLISPNIKTKLLSLADNSSTREAITKVQLENFKIPLPNLEEQRKIVAEIEKIETKITVLEKEIEAIPQQKEETLKKYLY